MEIKTETGIILQHLNYEDYQVQRFDDLAFHLYCIPVHERDELLAALMYQFSFKTESEYYKAKVKQFNKIMANRK